MPLPLLQNKHRIEFHGPVFEWLLLQKKDAERRSPSTSPLSFSRGSAAYTYVWAIVFVGSGNLLRNGIRLDRQEVKIYGAPFFLERSRSLHDFTDKKKCRIFPPLSAEKCTRRLRGPPRAKANKGGIGIGFGNAEGGGRENWVRARGGGHKRCRCLFLLLEKEFNCFAPPPIRTHRNRCPLSLLSISSCCWPLP